MNCCIEYDWERSLSDVFGIGPAGFGTRLSGVDDSGAAMLTPEPTENSKEDSIIFTEKQVMNLDEKQDKRAATD